MTYKEACKLLDKARNGQKKLARNTYLITEGENKVVRFWNTDIIIFRPDGTTVLNSGGYRTLTTKDRLNRFSPISIGQDRGNWWMFDYTNPDSVRTLFADGIVVDEAGTVISGAGSEDAPALMRKVDRLVSKYISGYAAHVVRNGLEEPSGGDCWGCHLGGANSDALGNDHYLLHFEEGYFVPSLLWNAINEAGYSNPSFIWHIIAEDARRGKESYHLKNTLRRFFRVRKQRLVELLQQQAAA